MTLQESNKLIKKILDEGAVESGIFISLLSKKYQKFYEVSRESFIQSLNNSLDKLESEDLQQRIDNAISYLKECMEEQLKSGDLPNRTMLAQHIQNLLGILQDYNNEYESKGE